jgi:hypothetical protein
LAAEKIKTTSAQTKWHGVTGGGDNEISIRHALLPLWVCVLSDRACFIRLF